MCIYVHTEQDMAIIWLLSLPSMIN